MRWSPGVCRDLWSVQGPEVFIQLPWSREGVHSPSSSPTSVLWNPWLQSVAKCTDHRLMVVKDKMGRAHAKVKSVLPTQMIHYSNQHRVNSHHLEAHSCLAGTLTKCCEGRTLLVQIGVVRKAQGLSFRKKKKIQRRDVSINVAMVDGKALFLRDHQRPQMVFVLSYSDYYYRMTNMRMLLG